MKAITRMVNDHGIEYQCLVFICPGCGEGHSGLHMLPVNTNVTSPSWTWDGNLEAPTIEPSILTKWGSDPAVPTFICHSFLRAGVFEFLGDCTHALAGQRVPIPDLPEWVVNE